MEFEDFYKRRANRSFGGDWIKLYMSNLHIIAFVAFVRDLAFGKKLGSKVRVTIQGGLIFPA